MTAERYQEIRRGGGIVNLASRLKLSFTGGDRQRYVNGQITANLLSAPNLKVVPACVTTAKGKLCADVFVSLRPGGILIDADSALAETLPARMERYIVADDVTMENVTDTIAIIHALGVQPAALAQITDTAALGSCRYGVPGSDVYLSSPEEFSTVWSKLRESFPAVDEELLETIRIERGVPRWGYELQEDTLPPEAGLDRTHIDYAKGCYIGQEVISRIKSVGHVNRHLVGFISQNGTPLMPGAEVHSTSSREKSCGTLTSATWSFALEKQIALGFLRRSAPAGDLIAVTHGSEPVPITLCDLPFIQ